MELHSTNLVFCRLSLVAGLLAMVCFVNEVRAEAKLYFVHNDHLGTPIAVTDDNQALVWEAKKEPFGETQVSGSIRFDPRFPGQLFDEETGYHYNYFRDYDPITGRYIQSDPIGLYGGANTYSYVSGNPLRAVDPKGLVEWDVFWNSAEAGKFIAAGGIYSFRFYSECLKGKKYAVEVSAFAGGAGAGSPVTIQVGKDTWEDGKQIADVGQFAGEFIAVSAAVGIGGGGGYSAVRVGEYRSQGWGFWGILGGGISETSGTAKIDRVRVWDCCEE